MFTLDQVVPWGRSFYDEYQRMFALMSNDLAVRILGCGDGPAAFNAEASRRRIQVVSCDPIYQWSRGELAQRIDDTSLQVLEQTRQNADAFNWNNGISTVDELGRVRLAAMQEFLDDFESGQREGRYVTAALPELPFDDEAFGLALCSHFLFLYSEQLGEAFHRQAIRELCRVAREVRIFPLLALSGARSPFVESVAQALGDAGCDVAIERVEYEFQRGGNEMMRIGCAGRTTR